MTLFVLIFWQHLISINGINLYENHSAENDIRVECMGLCIKPNLLNCNKSIVQDSNSILIKITNNNKIKVGVYCDESFSRVSPETVDYYFISSVNSEKSLQFLKIGEPNLKHICYLEPNSTSCFCMYFANPTKSNYFEVSIPIRMHDKEAPYDSKGILSFSINCIQ